MAISMHSLTWNASQAYVLCSYLRDLCERVGTERYLRSLVRLQHDSGTGFFGVSNTGSTDCAKERFRGITDSLEQTNRCWRGIDFVSESCTNTTAMDFRNVHRVEHTREVSDLYVAFEATYILPCRRFSANDVAVFVVRNQIVCLIEQIEQRPGRKFDHVLPFSKYTRKIYFDGSDVSQHSSADLVAINDVRYASLLTTLRELDFTGLNAKAHSRLTGEGRHTLPPLEMAERHGDDEFELVAQHYRHKLQKRTDPESAWYSAKDAERYREWLQQREATAEETENEAAEVVIEVPG